MDAVHGAEVRVVEGVLDHNGRGRHDAHGKARHKIVILVKLFEKLAEPVVVRIG